MYNTPQRQFAWASSGSGEPNVINFQLRFWELAITSFAALKKKWDTFEARGSQVRNPAYIEFNLLIDAAVIIVLAGTSVCALVGRNAQPTKANETPFLIPGFKELLGPKLKNEFLPRLESFWNTYSKFHHFGTVYITQIEYLSKADLCNYMKTAQDIWILVLERQRFPIDDKFRRSYLPI